MATERPSANGWNRLTENTLVPVSLVIVMVGGVAWLNDIHASTRQNALDIERVENLQIEYLHSLQRIDERLSRIEGRLGIKSGKIGDDDGK